MFEKQKQVPESKKRLFLRRGPHETVENCIPYHIGEMILCTDTPVLCVATSITVGGFIFLEIPPEARGALVEHYGSELLRWNAGGSTLIPSVVL